MKFKITKKGLWAVTHFGMIGAGLALPSALVATMILQKEVADPIVISSAVNMADWTKIGSLCDNKKHKGPDAIPHDLAGISEHGDRYCDQINSAVIGGISYLRKIDYDAYVITHEGIVKGGLDNTKLIPLFTDIKNSENGWRKQISFGVLSIVSVILLLLYGNYIYLPQRTRKAADEKHAEIMGKMEGTKVDIDKDTLIKKIRVNALQLKINNGSITDKEIKELEKLVK